MVARWEAESLINTLFRGVYCVKAEHPICLFATGEISPSKEDVLARWIHREFPPV